MASYHYSTAAFLAALITFGAVWAGYRATQRDQRLGIDGGWPVVLLILSISGSLFAFYYLQDWLLQAFPVVWLLGQILVGNLIACCLVGVLHSLVARKFSGRAERVYFSLLVIAFPVFAIYALSS